ncbi:MAG: addiction module protein [Cyanobacteria bacterium P01_D01_bin.44]
MPVTDAQKQELDHRLDNYHQIPEAGSSWHNVKLTRLTEG